MSEPEMQTAERSLKPSAMKALRWTETALWATAVVLLTTYAGARWWYAHGRDQGVAAFEASRASVHHAPSSSPASIDAASGVDMSDWSRERVERYREALQGDATPQGVLRIPSVKLVVPVYDRTSELNLNRGAGRIEGTARIGAAGNVGIAAHRDGFFRALKDVRIGDIVMLEHLAAKEAYRIVSTRIVDPDDVSVLQPTTAPSVTLVTCYPFYYVGSAPRRFIVRAEQVEEKTPADATPAGGESRIASGEEILSDGGDTGS